LNTHSLEIYQQQTVPGGILHFLKNLDCLNHYPFYDVILLSLEIDKERKL